MQDNLSNSLTDKIKQLGIGNLIIIVVFLIALVVFIFNAIGYYWNKITGKDKVEVITYDYTSASNYSIEAEGNYKLKLVDGYNDFYNVEDIYKSFERYLANGAYDDIYKVLSSNFKSSFTDKNDFTTKMSKYYQDNFDPNEIYSEISNIDEIYTIEESNIYICNIKNKKDELKRIVFSVDFSQGKYLIEEIEL